MGDKALSSKAPSKPKVEAIVNPKGPHKKYIFFAIEKQRSNKVF